MEADPHFNIFEAIQCLCRDFGRELKHGNTPRIEDWLIRIAPAARETLFQNLLHLEIESRRRRGQLPQSAEYIGRFPAFGSTIRQAFFESITMSPSSAEQTGEDTTQLIGVRPARRIGDYELLRELGRGGFGVVYEARHIKRDDRVALKTIPPQKTGEGVSADAERLHKFRREFRALAEINHPNLVGMQSLEVDSSQWFFTMDLVSGVDFLSYVRPHDALDVSRLRSAARQLASGIMALHTQHVVHRDLKPGNVMVDDEGRVVILDFGLVVELTHRATDQTASMQSRQFAGTVPYAAPEQFSGRQNASSDWYAFGVMLYEALCGEKPFRGTTAEIIAQKQRDLPTPVTGRWGATDDIAELADGLLARDPDERPDALQVAKTLSFDIPSSNSQAAKQDAPSIESGNRTLLIGRQTQLGELKRLAKLVRVSHKPAAAFISGFSGEGKTSLAEEFLSSIHLRSDALVLAGRCYDRESVPFKAIDSVIDALVSFLRRLPVGEVKQLLPKDVEMLAHLFPLLRRVDVIATHQASNHLGLDSKQVRDRAFGALKRMLASISRQHSIVLFVDDLQWGDADSANVLARIMTPPEPPAVFFLGSYRIDETEESPFILEWETLTGSLPPNAVHPTISVGPLSEPECVSLVVARVGQDTENIRQRANDLFRATGGNPYFLNQLIECFDPETGSFSPAPLHEVIDTKLNRLPQDASLLLNVVAASGHALSVQ